MLESIGEALKADKVMIFEEDEENVSATYEWKKEGVPSTIDKLQKIPREKAKALYQGYVPSEVTIINDPERMNKALKDGNISAVKINSLVSGHLAINRKSFGFVEVVNPAPDRLKDASLLLTAVTRFLSVLIRNRDIYKRLRQLGNTDQLTGVMNGTASWDSCSTSRKANPSPSSALTSMTSKTSTTPTATKQAMKHSGKWPAPCAPS